MTSRLSAAEAARLRSAPLTYAERGQTRADLPAGYETVRISRSVGTGASAYERATTALLTWAMHDRSGLRPRTDTDRIVEGSVAILYFGWGLLRVRIPVRVVYLATAPRKQGFAYGTLPGHPEQGEEAFMVEWRPDDTVEVSITAFSRPGRWFTRLGRPVGRAVQRRVTERYLSALHEAAQGR
jgi:uncharacterized protein (UPF0548 family)